MYQGPCGPGPKRQFKAASDDQGAMMTKAAMKRGGQRDRRVALGIRCRLFGYLRRFLPKNLSLPPTISMNPYVRIGVAFHDLRHQ